MVSYFKNMVVSGSPSRPLEAPNAAPFGSTAWREDEEAAAAVAAATAAATAAGLAGTLSDEPLTPPVGGTVE